MRALGFSSLLTPAEASPKLVKGAGLRVRGAIMHLTPVDIAFPGRSVCPWATEGCSSVCLVFSGRGQTRSREISALEAHSVQRPRLARTRLFWRDRARFLSMLGDEIARLARSAERRGERPAVRLNGTSDLPWEALRHPSEGWTLPERFPSVQFYDYTKGERRALRFASGAFPANYHLTFSRSEKTRPEALARLLRAGVSCAVVFAGERVPRAAVLDGERFRVIDGTAHDYRFRDPRGVIVGLLPKGPGKRDASGFVVRDALARGRVWIP